MLSLGECNTCVSRDRVPPHSLVCRISVALFWVGRHSFVKRVLADVEQKNGQLKERVAMLEEKNLRWEVG